MNRLLISSLLTCAMITASADTLYDKRFKRWQAEAEKGNALAQYSLGNSYLRGNEVKIDVNEAIRWFEAAAKQGHSKSEYKLGYIYYTGKGVNRDYGKAAHWFRSAAEKNYAPAQFYLGKCYAEGKGVKQDAREALDWLNKAKANDYTPANREIASLQLNIKQAPQQTSNNKKPEPTVTAKVTAKEAAKPKKKTITIPKNGKIDVLEILQQGDWKIDNKPAENMPSNLTACSYDKKVLKCETKKIVTANPFAEITYKVESKFSHFNEKGEFMTIYRRNNLQVLPSDPDDPEPNPEYIPRSGWGTNSVMKCKVVSESSINCYTDTYKTINYSRK